MCTSESFVQVYWAKRNVCARALNRALFAPQMPARNLSKVFGWGSDGWNEMDADGEHRTGEIEGQLCSSCDIHRRQSVE